MKTLACLAAASTAALAGCAVIPDAPTAQQDFFERLRPLCGDAFEGRATSAPSEADAPFASQRLVMHVASCTEDEIRIPFHVGEDRSRTWVVTRTAEGLRLKHIHRHEDGSEDELSNYGGDAVGPGSARRQEFPADAFSRALFERTGRAVSAANIWALEIDPGRTFAYELTRPERHFRAEFDLTRRIAPPPPAWGPR